MSLGSAASARALRAKRRAEQREINFDNALPTGGDQQPLQSLTSRSSPTVPSPRKKPHGSSSTSNSSATSTTPAKMNASGGKRRRNSPSTATQGLVDVKKLKIEPKEASTTLCVAAAVATKPQLVTKHNYSLRSRSQTNAGAPTIDNPASSATKDAAMGPNTVTPAAPRSGPRCHLDFDSRNPRSAANKISDNSDSPASPEADPKQAWVNIYPTANASRPCHCFTEPIRRRHHNDGKAFLAQYGHDILDFLKDWEKETFNFLSSPSQKDSDEETENDTVGSAAGKSIAGSGSPCLSGISCSSAESTEESTEDHKSVSSSSSHQGRKSVYSTCSQTPSKDSNVSGASSSASSSESHDNGSLTLLTYKDKSSSTLFLEDYHALISGQHHITQRMRAVLVSWLTEVGMEYRISDQAFHLGVSLIDRLLRERESNPWNDDEDVDELGLACEKVRLRKHNFQAYGCACLWMAAKIEDKSAPLQEDFYFISDHSVSPSELRRSEKRICRTLNFRLQSLSPSHYINPFLRASTACGCRMCESDNTQLRELVNYLLYLGRLSYDLMNEYPSKVAAAAVYLARATLKISQPGQAFEGNPFWTSTLHHYTGWTPADMEDVILVIYKYYLQAEQLSAAAFDKFRRSDRGRVALITAPRIEQLGLVSRHQDVKHDNLRIITPTTP